MLTPDQFEVNETWIAARVNEDFLFVQDEPYDIYILMDAASTYVFGHVALPVTNETPDKKDVEALFKRASEAKNQWAEILILTENAPAESVFKTCAERNGLSIKVVPLSDIEPILGPVKRSFESDLIGRTTDQNALTGFLIFFPGVVPEKNK